MPTKHRRLAVPVTDQLQSLVDLYKQTYSNQNLSDTEVLKKLIQIGAKVWYKAIEKKSEEVGE